jgi:hypothetical protein
LLPSSLQPQLASQLRAAAAAAAAAAVVRCIMVWIKSMGRQILQGNLNLVNTSFPVLMFEPRSYLQVRQEEQLYS